LKNDYKSTKFLLLFFGITLAWTWLCGFIPVMAGLTGTPAGTFLFYFGGGAPSVTALFLVFLTYPVEVRRDYFHRCFSFRYMGWKWPLFTLLYIPAVILLNFAVTFVYVKTKRSILAGALVHMLANLIGSQLLSPYSMEMSMCIRYVRMACCLAVAVYAMVSHGFRDEVKALFDN